MEKLFIIVRNDISLPYQGVQGGHALAQWMLENPSQTWNNQTLVYLQCDDIYRLMDKFERNKISYSKFIEPDLNDEVTAIATQEDKFVKNLKLIQ